MALLLGLVSSMLWGAADFAGGRLSRLRSAYSVIFVAQVAALVSTAVYLVAAAEPALDTAALAWGVVAGLAGAVALGAFYRALAIGQMGLVAPVASTSVVLPVVVGVVQGQTPPPLQFIGLATAGLGACLAVAPELRSGSGARASSGQSIGLALLAAAGFGVVLIAIAEGSRSSVPQTLFGQRAAYVVAVGLVLLLRAGRGERQPRWTRSQLGVAVAVGLADMAANLMYAHATHTGLLPVVSVLSSLYPVATVLLARWLDDERLRPLQLAGISATFLGVTLIGAG
ncbi:EamA family transporter [Streptomyces sp. SA15]|uniref:EamA family transporter n=1 Tax=Streptomyces sp. SA15 TaxID=934019 RepID=UPI0026D577C6|nr:EamA family transporter [Streptomyces sp. SA15]